MDCEVGRTKSIAAFERCDHCKQQRFYRRTLPNVHSFRIVMLLTDGFGGFGGIATFNADFLRALDLAPACGIPVIGSLVDGSREAIMGARLSRFVDPRSNRALYHAVIGTLESAEPRERNELVSNLVDRVSMKK